MSGEDTWDPDGKAGTIATIDGAQRGIGSNPLGREHRGQGHPSDSLLALPTASSTDEARYADRGILGRGGMGEVRLLEDAVLGRRLVRKEIRRDRVDHEALRRRFLTEARITAQLAHPGVVPVHDIGTLPDGRPFYTMREVRGSTLSEAIESVYGQRAPHLRLTRRRLLEVVLRAAETLAYAHSRGVIHRDLKPDNIMLGEFGAVLVLDWGLARALSDTDDALAGALSGEAISGEALEGLEGLTRAGRILGTPGYLPPEQARGQLEAMGPPSDVYSLGCLFYEVLTGRVAFPGTPVERIASALAGQVPELPETVEPELRALLNRALQPEPADRFPTAEGFARALDDWLAGARRRERALLAVAQADAHLHAHHEALAEAQRLRSQAATLLSTLKAYDPASAKKPGWALEDTAAEREAQAELEGTRMVSRLHGALQIEPALDEAHARLATWYRSRHEAAVREQRHGAAIRNEELLATHDRGEHAAYLEGMGVLALATSPPQARARVSRYEARDRRLEPVLVAEVGPEELAELRLPAGSYLLEVQAEDCAVARYPVLLERGGAWRGSLALLGANELAADEVYVPGGPFWSGGDPEAADGLPGRRVGVQGFVMKRFPVTNTEFLAFLNDLVDQGQTEEAEAWAPGMFREAGDAKQRRYGRTADGHFTLLIDHLEDPWQADHPVVSVTWLAAAAYCSWRAARDGLPWRLPHSLEWEKAARGVDGRVLPWGNHLEPTWANTVDGSPTRPTICGVEDFPLDVGPHGVTGLVGNAREWCGDPYRREGPVLEGDHLGPVSFDEDPEAWRVLKGGSCWNGSALVRPATRFGASPAVGFDVVGFRLTRSLPGELSSSSGARPRRPDPPR